MKEDRAISKTYENKYKEKDYLKDYITADSFTELNAESACSNVHLNTNENEATIGLYILITTSYATTVPTHPFCWDGGGANSCINFWKWGIRKNEFLGGLKEFLP